MKCFEKKSQGDVVIGKDSCEVSGVGVFELNFADQSPTICVSEHCLWVRETFLFHLVLYVTIVSSVCLRFGSWFLLAKEENVHKGDYLQKTTNLFTVTGMAVLIHEDPKRLASDTGLHCDNFWHPQVYIVNNIKITNLSTPLGFIFLYPPSLRMLLLDIGSTIF